MSAAKPEDCSVVIRFEAPDVAEWQFIRGLAWTCAKAGVQALRINDLVVMLPPFYLDRPSGAGPAHRPLGPEEVGEAPQVTKSADVAELRTWLTGRAEIPPKISLLLVQSGCGTKISLLLAIGQALKDTGVPWALQDAFSAHPVVRLIPFGRALREGESGKLLASSWPVANVRQAQFMGLVTKDVGHVVLVIDTSGSMLDWFDRVRIEMMETITRLKASQTYHMIFFANGVTGENPPKRLVPATRENMAVVIKSIRGVEVGGAAPIDPAPALRRAFEVLANAPEGKGGKVIYLLTDSVFSDAETSADDYGAKLLKSLSGLNPKGAVKINTIYYAAKPNEQVQTLLKQIATQNGGRYRAAGRDE